MGRHLDSTLVPNGQQVFHIYTDNRKIRTEQAAQVENPIKVFFSDLHSHCGYSDGALVPAAAKLAGNRCELLTWEGLKHGFFNFGRYNNKSYLETVRAADKFLASLDYLKGESTIEAPE